MELAFSLDDDDYRDFVKHARARVDTEANIRAKLSPLAWAFWSCAALGVAATAYFWMENRGAFLGYWYAALAFVVGWIVTGYWYLRRYNELQTANFTSSGGSFKEQRRLNVSESGVSVVTATSTQHFQWKAILSFRQSDRQFFLHLDTAAAICVPRRAFPSPEQAQTFSALVERHVQNG